MFFCFSSRRRHTRCALVTGVQTCALPISAEQKARRKQATDVIHDKFYLLRDIAERRRIQLDRMRTGYLNAIKHHKSSKCELPFSFSISDETVLPSGHIKNVRHSFNLWTAKALRTAQKPSAGENRKSVEKGKR